MTQTSHSIEREVIQHIQLDYLQYLPPDHGKDPDQKWPMILFLHGAGERGDNLEKIKVHGIPKVVETRDIPFVTLSPQCPVNYWWADFMPALEALVIQAVGTLNVDPQRIYLTGLSMGGFGTWQLACEYAHLFSAIVPICGGGHWAYGFPERVRSLRDIPTWAFHGAKDDVVPLSASQVMVDALAACGGNVRLTVYPEAKHDSWTQTYDNPALYEWLLAQKKAC